MYRNSHRNHVLAGVLTCALSITSIFSQEASANRFELGQYNAKNACKNASNVEPNSTHRDSVGDREEAHLVRLELPSAGILTLDVTSAQEPRINVSNHGCDDSISSELLTIERSAAHLALAARDPGTYYFRLGAQDPSQTLGDYKLTTGFVGTAVAEDEFHLDELTVTRTHFYTTGGISKVGEEDTDPGTGGLWDPTKRLLVSIASLEDTWRQKVGEEDTDPGTGGLWDPNTRKVGEEDTDPGTGGLWDPNTRKIGEEDTDPGTGGLWDPNTRKVGEEDTDPGTGGFSEPTRWVLTADSANDNDLLEWAQADAVQQVLWPEMRDDRASIRAANASGLRFATDRLCGQGELDDHSDSLRCATPIAANEIWTGEISNDWGDDTDTFSFTLSELETVHIKALGDIEADLTIYDRFGHQLKRQVGSVVSTLGPGDYFVRIAADQHAEGAYELGMELLEW